MAAVLGTERPVVREGESDMIVCLMIRTSVRVVGSAVIALGCSLYGQEFAVSAAIAAVPVAAALAQRSSTTVGLTQPLTASQRWAYYIHRTYSPHRLGLLAAETAMDHALREPTCWDRGLASYVTRYARAFDRRLIRNTAEFGLGFLTGEDLRYQPLFSGPLHGRFWHSVRSAVVAGMSRGTEQPAYARFAAAALAEVSTAHWIGRPLEPGWVAETLGWGVLDQIQNNLLDEFGPDFRRFGRRVGKRVWRALELSR